MNPVIDAKYQKLSLGIIFSLLAASIVIYTWSAILVTFTVPEVTVYRRSLSSGYKHKQPLRDRTHILPKRTESTSDLSDPDIPPIDPVVATLKEKHKLKFRKSRNNVVHIALNHQTPSVGDKIKNMTVISTGSKFRQIALEKSDNAGT